MEFRKEHDSMGDVLVPSDRYWGAQTQRSCENFSAGNQKMPIEVIRALAVIKKASAKINNRFGKLDDVRTFVICKVCDEIMSGKLDDHFPLSVYQTGSGTQTNMNVNEVIANRGNEVAEQKLIHPNDHANMSQSSNDVFPSAMHIAGVIAIEEKLIPAVRLLANELMTIEDKYMDIIKTGRTHLQDATPLTLGQEISGWRSMAEHDIDMIEKALPDMMELALGGTAVGTGLNAPSDFARAAAAEISKITGYDFVTAKNKFYALTSKDAIVNVHGAVKALACDLMKIANDVRWLSSGPRCGIGEIRIPANEPGSSIMPGKVNPTQCEAVTMAAVRVMGNDTAITVAASQGNFQLNVFMPVTISAFLESVNLLSDVIKSFAEKCVSGIEPDRRKIEENLSKSLMLVTALNTHIGYDKAAEIAKTALSEDLSLREAAIKTGIISGEEFDEYVKPEKMV